MGRRRRAETRPDPRGRRPVAGGLCKPGLAACLGATLLAIAGVAGGSAAAAGDGDQLESTLRELRQVVHAINLNHAAQKKAWPTRDADLLEEQGPPLRVRKLQQVQRQLEGRTRLLLTRTRLQTRASPDLRLLWRERDADDVRPLIAALGQAGEIEFIEALLPIAIELGKHEPAVADVLLKRARQLETCPHSLVNALAELDNSPQADLLLMQRGEKQNNVSMLRAAVSGGDPALVRRLVRIADGKRGTLRRAARRALARLDPPSSVSTTELESLVRRQITTVRSIAVKASLIAYLGFFASRANLGFLRRLYESADDDTIRIAAVGAIGRLGGEVTGFLVEEIKKPETLLTVRRSCVHALGSSRHAGEGFEILVPLLDDPDLKQDARRALRRIVGEDLGVTQGPWVRWWRSKTK